jgi:hypothetical protein
MKGANMAYLLMKLRVFLGFMRSPNPEVNEYTLGIIEGMKNNPAFPDPPLPIVPPVPPDPTAPTDLQTLQQSFSAACVAAGNGGTDLTADMNEKGELLKDALHSLALYVQIKGRYSLSTLLSSGFEACSTNRASVPLDQPVIVALVNETSGQLLLRGGPVLNARAYQAQMSLDGGKTWINMGEFNGARRIVLQPVTPGTVYTVQFRALGGSTKYSAWSDPVSHIAT